MDDLIVKENIIIPAHEIIITASRAGGPGGQHVNKTSTRITIAWNARTTNALSDEQKTRVLEKLHTRLTKEGVLIISSGATRSQQQNKALALEQLKYELRKGLHVPKKRMKTRMPHRIKEALLQTKKHRSTIKKRRRENFED